MFSLPCASPQEPEYVLELHRTAIRFHCPVPVPKNLNIFWKLYRTAICFLTALCQMIHLVGRNSWILMLFSCAHAVYVAQVALRK